MGGLNVANRYTFNGPFTDVGYLLQESGVYLISVLEDGVHKVLDVGESQDLHNRVKTHDRALQWQLYSGGKQIHVSSYYCNESTRMLIERELRAFFNPVCGIR